MNRDLDHAERIMLDLAMRGDPSAGMRARLGLPPKRPTIRERLARRFRPLLCRFGFHPSTHFVEWEDFGEYGEWLVMRRCTACGRDFIHGRSQ